MSTDRKFTTPRPRPRGNKIQKNLRNQIPEKKTRKIKHILRRLFETLGVEIRNQSTFLSRLAQHVSERLSARLASLSCRSYPSLSKYLQRVFSTEDLGKSKQVLVWLDSFQSLNKADQLAQIGQVPA